MSAGDLIWALQNYFDMYTSILVEYDDNLGRRKRMKIYLVTQMRQYQEEGNSKQ